jgi:hypothetical protein
MVNSTEALKLALDFVETVHVGEWVGSIERQLEVITAIKEALTQRTEQNFCSRCGKRVGGIDSIHTCTPPMEKNT